MLGHTPSLPSRLAVLLGVALAAACTGDAPLDPERPARPDRPSLLVNPLCTGSGGTTHGYATITTTVSWWPAGNPHRVTGSQIIDSGGSLRLRPGVLVCFDPYTGIQADNGGQLAVDGDDTARVVLTAADPAHGWSGINLQGTPAATSFIGHARVEHVNVSYVAVTAYDPHTVVLDSVTIRQSGRAAYLLARHARIIDSRVDTTTYPYAAAVALGDSARFIRTTVRKAAGIGVDVQGQSGVQLLGGRIEGSGGTGLRVIYSGSVHAYDPIRITGGGGYPAEMPIDVLAKGHNTVAEMDSLVGNARDTLVTTGGTLISAAYATSGLPWRVDGWITVDAGGSLRPQPGAHLAFQYWTLARFQNGGRLLARGTQAAPVVFTAADPAFGWLGIQLYDVPSSISYLTNAHVRDVNVYYTAVSTDASHAVDIDSTVFYRVGSAALLQSGSRMKRTRVDTTLSGSRAAVELWGNARLESTLIRGASGVGVAANDSTVQIVSCEVRESVGDGIQMLYQPVEVHDCNLVNNGGLGVNNVSGVTADVEDNWWGDAAGPLGTSGDGVYGGDYTPWRTTPFVLPYVP
jgi:hypothetical protein